MAIINTTYGGVPALTNPAEPVDVTHGKEFIDANGDKQIGGAANYTKLLQACNVIPTTPGSIDLFPDDFPVTMTTIQRTFMCSTNTEKAYHQLRSISIPERIDSIPTSSFVYCGKMKFIRTNGIFTSNAGSPIATGCVNFVFADTVGWAYIRTGNPNAIFLNCSVLNTLIIRKTDTPQTYFGQEISGTAIANGNGHIYVPTSLIDSYKEATGWSAYASAFMPLYIVSSEAERQEKLADDTVIDGSMIVYDDGEWDFGTMTGTRYTVKGSV